jgi:hypothetical protein
MKGARCSRLCFIEAAEARMFLEAHPQGFAGRLAPRSMKIKAWKGSQAQCGNPVENEPAELSIFEIHCRIQTAQKIKKKYYLISNGYNLVVKQRRDSTSCGLVMDYHANVVNKLFKSILEDGYFLAKFKQKRGRISFLPSQTPKPMVRMIP